MKKKGRKQSKVVENKFPTLGELYRRRIKFVLSSKNYICSIILFFFIASLIGFFLNNFVDDMFQNLFKVSINESLINYFKELVASTEGMNQLQITSFIFINNFSSSLGGLMFGVFFGLYPLIGSIVNGYIIGFVLGASLLVRDSPSLIELVVFKLLPHGIFELPAVFISLGLGLKIGTYQLSLKNKSKGFTSFVLSMFIFLVIFSVFSFILYSLFSMGGNFDAQSISESPFFTFLILFVFIFSFMMSTFFGNLSLSEKERKIIFSNLKIYLIESLYVFFLIVLPLLIIAAIIEGSLVFLFS